tara:strand:- start:85 stop:1953 length:1869 start_codon:yes stop_codon:yes gene_type:complete
MTDSEIIEKYQEDLDQSGFGDRYKIVSLHAVLRKKQTIYKFLFQDTHRGIEFIYNYASMKHLLKKDPTHRFRPTSSRLKGVSKWEHALEKYPHLVPKRVKKGFCVIEDTRYGYEFTYKSVHQLLNELEKDPVRTFTSVLDENAKWASKIEKLAPDRFSDVRVVGSTGGRPLICCYDSLEDDEIKVGWPHLRSSLRKNPRHRFEESLTDDPVHKWQKKVNKLGASHLNILFLEHNCPVSGYRFRILDSREDYEFSYSAYNLQARLKEDPNYNFRLDIPVPEYYQKALDDILPGRFLVVDHIDTKKSLTDSGAVSSVSHLIQVKDLINDEEFVKEGASLLCLLKESPCRVIASNIDRFVDGKLIMKRTGIEATVESWIKSLGIDYEFNSFVSGVRPDFVIPSAMVAIECDGLYWHSELKRDKNYHINKRDTLEKAGYRHLAFRKDEIISKPEVCQSIISNALGLSRKVYARKCSHSTSLPLFFEENHLMGKGSGRVYSLDYEGHTVAAIQVKWVPGTGKRVLDISRFCTSKGISVVGGWSRLVKRVIEKEKPDKIQTFIDRRYGTGSHLPMQGWSFVREGVSFGWTDFTSVFHRLRYPGKTGYEHGLVKIWDCGQAKWELAVLS